MKLPAVQGVACFDFFIWVRFVFLSVGLFHNILQSRVLMFFIWVRFVKIKFITSADANQNVNFPMENNVFGF